MSKMLLAIKNLKLWLIILALAWIALLVGISTTCQDWNMLMAISTWVLAGGIGLAVWQVFEARRSTNAQIAMELFRELRSDKALEPLRFIYSLKPEQDMQTLHTSDLDSIEYVLDRLDVLSVLVANGLIDKKLAIDAYAGVTALRCWYILHQHIEKIRHKRKYFGDNFEAFTNCCLKYFNKAHIKVGFENTYVTIEDLVKKLEEAKKKRVNLGRSFTQEA